LEPEVVDLGNGQFSVCYLPPTEGMFELSICRHTGDGWTHIADSPFMVHVDAGQSTENTWSVRGAGLWWAEVDTVTRFDLVPPVSEYATCKTAATDFEAFLQTASGVVLPTFHPSPTGDGGFIVQYKCARPGFWQLVVRNRMDGSLVSGSPTWVLVSTFEEQARALLLNALDMIDRMEPKQRALHRERRGKSALPIVARELVHSIAAIEAEDTSLTSLNGMVHPIDLVGRLAAAIAAGDNKAAREALSEEIQTANALANELGLHYAKMPSASAWSQEEQVARIARALAPTAVALRLWRSPAPMLEPMSVPTDGTPPNILVVESVPWLLDGESLAAGIARLADTLAAKENAEVITHFKRYSFCNLRSHILHSCWGQRGPGPVSRIRAAIGRVPLRVDKCFPKQRSSLRQSCLSDERAIIAFRGVLDHASAVTAATGKLLRLQACSFHAYTRKLALLVLFVVVSGARSRADNCAARRPVGAGGSGVTIRGGVRTSLRHGCSCDSKGCAILAFICFLLVRHAEDRQQLPVGLPTQSVDSLVVTSRFLRAIRGATHAVERWRLSCRPVRSCAELAKKSEEFARSVACDKEAGALGDGIVIPAPANLVVRLRLPPLCGLHHVSFCSHHL
jgi:hypothetical protein